MRTPEPSATSVRSRPLALLPGNVGWILSAGLALTLLGLVTPSQTQSEPVRVPVSGYGTADSNGQMIAVTGIDVTGSSILYLIDTQSRNLAIYKADGGASSTKGVELVGARNIDLDLRLDGFNDRSDYTYKELLRQFEKEERDDSDG